MFLNEELHKKIGIIAIDKNCSFFDAIIIYLEENNLEVEDIIKDFDKFTILRARQSAIDNNLVQRRVYLKYNILPFY